MKRGKFFRIPESPIDLDRLRRDGSVLDDSTRPAWLNQSDSDCYRYLGSRIVEPLGMHERDVLREEIQRLEEVGLIVDRDPANTKARRLYIPSVADYDLWSIGIYQGASPFALAPTVDTPNPVLTREDVTDARAALVADPFMIREGHDWFMFFEVLNWNTNKGEIALATSNDGIHWRYQQRVLAEPFHLSYPYVFTSGGEHFMVPEARQSGAVRLYRAVEFPTIWSFVATILKGHHLVDPSIFRKNDRWWLFAGCESSGRHDTLRLYSAHSIIGHWQEHPASPIVQGDPHAARPAGRVLVDNGRVYRFAQNCYPYYGIDVRAFEITNLTAKAYHETLVDPSPILRPTGKGWNASGMHHIDAQRLDDGSWLAAVDGWNNSLSREFSRDNDNNCHFEIITKKVGPQ